MATGRNIRAGRAFVELGLDKSAFVRGLNSAANQLKAFGGRIRNIGAGIAAAGAGLGAPLIAATKLFSNVGDSIAKMSKRTGISTQALAELGFAAGLSGTSIEDVEKSIRAMSRVLLDARQGLSTAKKSLELLGLSVEELSKLNPEQQFLLIADRLSKIENPSTRAAAAMEIFGRAGTMLLPMLENGAAGIEAMRKEARELGITMSEDDARSAEELNDALGRFLVVVKQVTLNIGAALAPAITSMSNGLAKAGAQVSKFISNNRDLIILVANAAGVLIVFGGALITLGVTMQIVGFAIAGLVKLLAFAGAAMAAMVSPIGLIIAGLVGIAAAALQAGGGFGALKDDALVAFEGIKAALLKGDIEAAGRVLFKSLEIVWMQGVNGLKAIWFSMIDGLINAWDGFVSLVLMGVEKIIGGLANLVENIGDLAAFFGADQLAIDLVEASDAARAFQQSFREARAERDAEAGSRINAREAETADAIRKANDELERLRGELRQIVDDITKPGVSPGPEFGSPGFGAAGSGATAAIKSLGESLTGGFGASAGALLGLQRGGFAKEMVDEQRTTNELLEELNDNIGNNVFRFGGD